MPRRKALELSQEDLQAMEDIQLAAHDREFGEMKTVDELAKLMGVHKQTILRYIKKRKLQAVRMGNRYRIPIGAYRRFMFRNETYAEYFEIEPYRD